MASKLDISFFNINGILQQNTLTVVFIKFSYFLGSQSHTISFLFPLLFLLLFSSLNGKVFPLKIFLEKFFVFRFGRLFADRFSFCARFFENEEFGNCENWDERGKEIRFSLFMNVWNQNERNKGKFQKKQLKSQVFD